LEEFKVSTEKKVKVIFGEEEFFVRKPKVSDSLKLTAMLKDVEQGGVEQTQVMLEWLDSLGLPRRVVDDMYQSDLIELVEKFLTDGPKKK
jgi:hypothetical protein